MGLEMSPGTVIAQLDEMNQNLGKAIERVNALQERITNLENTKGALQGDAYDSVREYYHELHLPVLRGMLIYLEETVQNNKLYRGCIAGYLSGIGYVDEDALKEDLENLRQQMDYVRGLMNRKGYPSSVSGLLGSMEQAERLLEKKLEQIDEFLAASAAIYSSLDGYRCSVKSGIDCLHSSIFDGIRIDYQVDCLNMDWARALEQKWLEREVKQKELYVEAMKEHFGFDDQTAEIMYKLYYNMRCENVENVNQRYFAILASYVYSDSAGKSIKNYVWHEIAGTENEEVLTNQLISFGINESERELLKQQIENNYKRCWLKDAAKAGAYYQKNDLSHMSVISATMLNNYSKDWEIAGGFAGWLCNGIYDLEANAGYVGDVYGTAGNGAKLTQDDYKADLDAVNLCARLQKDSNAIDVIGQYYAGISAGTVNRANEFVVNLGNGDYEKGKGLLENQLQEHYKLFKRLGSMTVFSYMGIEGTKNTILGGGIPLASDIYKEKEEIERNFYSSLLAGSNEYMEIEKVDIDLVETGKYTIE